MRIALLCMSVEPGRDGVGDYVLQLARAASTRGHTCQIVALADRFIEQPSVGLDPQDGFEIVRIPVAQWARTEINLAVERLAQFRPDWVSLQMVCYGFEKRGLLWRSVARFARLRAAPNRHLMFHELWIGAGRKSPPKDRAIGWIQRRLLQRTTRMWSPKVIHTSNAVYREMLHRAKINAQELPLPGNIPVLEVDPVVARARILQQLNPALPPGQSLLAAVFGSIHPQWRDPTWMDQVASLCTQQNRRLVIVQFGRAGMSGLEVLHSLRSHTAGRVDFLELGERPAEEISALLQGVDFGVATTPWPLIGKSGTAAAMLEHGLPVLVTREDAVLRGRTLATSTSASHPRLFRLKPFCEALEQNRLPRSRPQVRSDIYDAFIGALEFAS